MSPAFKFLLDECFWEAIDRGIPANATSLMLGRHNDQPLLEIVQSRFGLNQEQALYEIESARQEVRL